MKVVLFRDFSRNSERAEKLLVSKKVDYISVFSSPSERHVLPTVIKSHAVYTDLNGVVDFLRTV